MILATFGMILGYKYRLSAWTIFILWGMIYLGQKNHYNNHYYLIWLISFIMIFVPANAYASIDAKQHPKIKSNYCPQWSIWIFIGLISIVYFYATLAKFYPDWLDGTVTTQMFQYKTTPKAFVPLYQFEYFPIIIAYLGILFDGLIIPALLYKKTRWIAVVASLIFHIFNSITLQIGVFPYFALSFCIFFFPAEQIKKRFFPKKTPFSNTQIPTNTYSISPVLKYLIVPFFIIQITYPLRHWFIKGNVLYTEEGHRHAWRMMLRGKSGEAQFLVIDKNTQDTLYFDNTILLNNHLRRGLNKPDFIWQMAQKIKQYYHTKGKSVEIYCYNSSVLINGKPHAPLIDPKVNLAAEKWHIFQHEKWIILPK